MIRDLDLSAVVFLGTLSIGALAVTPQVVAGGLPDAPVWQGQWAGELSSRFESGWPGQELAVGVWGALEYGLLASGRRGVLVGTDDWLYTSEELEISPDSSARQARAVQLVRAAADQLSGHGGTVVVALIPDKSRVCGDTLRRHQRPAELEDRYAQLRSSLIEAGAVVPDLTEVLACTGTEPEPFLRTDTHWSPEGAAAVATQLAEQLPQRQGSQKFRELARPDEPHTGDLVSFLALGSFESALGPAPSILRTRSVVADAQVLDSAALFGDTAPAMVLVGTSFSADSRWGFADSLRWSFRQEVDNRAASGEGPFEPMQRFVDAPDAQPAVLIWEFPERYLAVESPAPESTDVATPKSP